MNMFLKLSIIVVLLFAIGFVVAKKENTSCGGSCSDCQHTSEVKEGESSCESCPSGGSCSEGSSQEIVAVSSGAGLPKLIDFGKTECIPCKMMEPVLESLKENYVEKLQVEFINTELDPAAVEKFNITGIPTQIFLDAEGNELYRNVGYLPEEKILAKWKELGIDL